MINRKRADHILLKMVNYHSRDVHGNGIPDGNGNPMGMGQKNIISHGSGKGNGNNVEGRLKTRDWKTRDHHSGGGKRDQ